MSDATRKSPVPIRVRAGLLAAVLLVVASVFSATAASRSLTPRQTVRAYILAMNARDGKSMCALLHPRQALQMARHTAANLTYPRSPRPMPCAKLTTLFGLSSSGRAGEQWARSEIHAIGRAVATGDGLVRIDVRVRDHLKNGSIAPVDRKTRFWLVRKGGRWVIARAGSMLGMAIWAEIGSGFLASERPATRELGSVRVKLPLARFTCKGQEWAYDDRVGEFKGARSMDVRRVELSRTPATCVTVTMQGRLRAGTVFEFSLARRETSQSWGKVDLIIEADGRIAVEGYGLRPTPPVRYGRGPNAKTLVVAFPAIPFHADEVHLYVAPVWYNEPLIHTQPPPIAGDLAP